MRAKVGKSWQKLARGGRQMVRLLVVEDDQRLNKVVTEVLRVNGFDATGLLTAAKALDELESQSYDLIISDIMMPEMDGFCICRNGTRV